VTFGVGDATGWPQLVSRKMMARIVRSSFLFIVLSPSPVVLSHG
jgi:hypothetical protein